MKSESKVGKTSYDAMLENIGRCIYYWSPLTIFCRSISMRHGKSMCSPECRVEDMTTNDIELSFHSKTTSWIAAHAL